MKLIDFWRLRRRALKEPCVRRPFHYDIAQALQRVLTGTLPTPNLMILMPPRCAKTDLGAKTFIAWALSEYPDSEFIVTSYSADLASHITKDIRSTLSSEWYREIISEFPFNPDKPGWGARIEMIGDRAGGYADYFHTSKGGSVKSTGIGGGITGFGAGKLREAFGGAIVIDDPLKAQDANSPAMRRSVVDFYNGALKTRRNRRGTPIILIMQRLHPEDLAGYCLQNERDEWTVLKIPAHELDSNETVWPQRIAYDELMAMKEARPQEYWSQYMQEPSESTLTIFKAAWWRYWNDVQDVERRITLKILTADTAFKARDSSDFSVLQCWGFEGTTAIYLMDQVRGKWEFPELLVQARRFMQRHAESQPRITPASEFWVEDKASGTSLVQSMRREGLPVRGWLPDEKTSPDKVGRANQCTMPISAGRVFLPNPKLPGYAWVGGFVNEHSAFTSDDSHLNDDQVDAQTMATLIWLQRGGGRGPLPTQD